jgi:hypothetical protein
VAAPARLTAVVVAAVAGLTATAAELDYLLELTMASECG